MIGRGKYHQDSIILKASDLNCVGHCKELPLHRSWLPNIAQARKTAPHSVRRPLALHETIRLGSKGLSGTNALVYFAARSETKKIKRCLKIETMSNRTTEFLFPAVVNIFQANLSELWPMF